MRPAGTRAFAAMLAMTGIAGCHQGAPPALSGATGTSGAVAVAGHAFGDTLVHAVRVLAFDRAKETAGVYVRKPDHMIVLAVEPGRDIEVIVPGGAGVKRTAPNTFTFFMRRVEVTATPASPDAAARARQAYEQCKAARAAALRAVARASQARCATAREESCGVRTPARCRSGTCLNAT